MKLIYIYIIIISYCQRGFPWISLNFRPYHPSLPADLLDYILRPYRTVVDKFLIGCPPFARSCEGVYWRTSHMSSSLLLQQCATCFVRLICVVLEMGGTWSYSWCFVDLFNIVRSILVHSSSNIFREATLFFIHIYTLQSISFLLNFRKKNLFFSVEKKLFSINKKEMFCTESIVCVFIIYTFFHHLVRSIQNIYLLSLSLSLSLYIYIYIYIYINEKISGLTKYWQKI